MKLFAFDDWLIDRVQAGSDVIHKITGWDCLHQSQMASIVVAAGWLLSIVERIQEGRGFFWMDGFCLAWRVYQAFFGQYGDDRVRRDAEMGLRNYRRIVSSFGIARICLLAVSVLACWFSLSGKLVIWGVALGDYLSACDVQPPAKGWIRETLRSLRTIWVPQAAGAKA